MRPAAAVLPLLLAALLVGCGESRVGSGQTKTENREVGEFDSLEVLGGADVTVRFGSPAAVSVTTDENLLALVTTEVGGDTLRVDAGSHRPTSGVKVRVTVPRLEEIRLDGAAQLEASGLQAEDLEIVLAGAGRMELAGVRVKRLDVEIDGSGSLKIEELSAEDVAVEIGGSGYVDLDGTTGRMSLDLAGSGVARLEDLVARTGRVDVEGSGKADVHVTDDLAIDVQGTGHVTYAGSPPKYRQEISKSARVERK